MFKLCRDVVFYDLRLFPLESSFFSLDMIVAAQCIFASTDLFGENKKQIRVFLSIVVVAAVYLVKMEVKSIAKKRVFHQIELIFFPLRFHLFEWDYYNIKLCIIHHKYWYNIGLCRIDIYLNDNVQSLAQLFYISYKYLPILTKLRSIFSRKLYFIKVGRTKWMDRKSNKVCYKPKTCGKIYTIFHDKNIEKCFNICVLFGRLLSCLLFWSCWKYVGSFNLCVNKHNFQTNMKRCDTQINTYIILIYGIIYILSVITQYKILLLLLLSPHRLLLLSQTISKYQGRISYLKQI